MKTNVNKIFFLFRDLGWLSFLVLAVGIASFAGLIQTQLALAAEAKTAAQYCGQYTTNTEKNACKDGLKGTDCQNYIDAGFGQEIADICIKAAKDLTDGVVKEGEVTVTPSPTTSPSPKPTTPSGQEAAENQSLKDQAKSLEEFLNILHETGQDSDIDTDEQADDTYGSYVNGAGKKQAIQVIKQGTGGSPAILFFNGGGWLANDCSGQMVAGGGNQPGGAAAGGGCPAYSGDAEKPGDRGYAMFDVTYRLGTSSVYYAFEDVMRGIKHMSNNAEMYGIDPNKIVIWGDSAGGSLSMRAAASGKSGAKAAVGWSPPTNAYTGLFRSFQSFGIGVAHSTCAPTDLAGFANFADLLNGGSGDVAEYGMGLNSNDFSALGIMGGGKMDPLTLLTQGMVAGKNLLSAANDVEAISSQIQSGGLSGLSGSAFNLVTKKFTECLDNFNVLSPALNASPDTPPSFVAGFEDDGVVGPNQVYPMRDKLRQLGIRSEALVLPGSEECRASPTAAGPAGAGGCHLGYYHLFVCPTLNFIDSIVQPEKGEKNCGTGVTENPAEQSTAGGSGSSGSSGGGGGSSGSGSGGNSGGGGGGSSNQNASGSNSSKQCTFTYTANGKVAYKTTGACDTNSLAAAEQSCKQAGGTYVADRSGSGKSGCNVSRGVCDTWDSSCNGGRTQSGVANASGSATTCTTNPCGDTTPSGGR